MNNDDDIRPTEDPNLRSVMADLRRTQAARLATNNAQRPKLQTPSNGDNVKYPSRLMAFTKGLFHDEQGFADTGHYEQFAEALTKVDSLVKPDGGFNVPTPHKDKDRDKNKYPVFCKTESGEEPGFRHWESPLAGHYFALEGPDPDEVAMAPAPRLGESELSAEMAEVYAMSLVRDMTFEELSEPTSKLYYVDAVSSAKVCYKINGSDATVSDLVDELNAFGWFGGGPVSSSLRSGHLSSGLSELEQRRRFTRRIEGESKLSAGSLFRGSLKGTKVGGYISQFMTLGAGSTESVQNSIIKFGAQSIDQRVQSAREGVDYMTSWAEWLDVQNGVKLTAQAPTNSAPSLTTTPRHLAEYVHIDQLYQAYFNACLILLANHGETENLLEGGFPNNNKPSSGGHVTREGFATFGGPHILSLLTEVASRGLRAVRRQKFQIHRRARPERLAAMLTLAANDIQGQMDNGEIATMKAMAKDMGMPIDGQAESNLMRWVAQYNSVQNRSDVAALRPHNCTVEISTMPDISDDRNYLLAMAFPEGSPMHPAYGAGHATVAGACVTVLKAFFRMTDDSGSPIHMSAIAGGDAVLTIEGELNKLASNISIGRDFAGVHYYSDYYDSLRMGERVAVGILQEQMLNYSEPVSMSFNSFDDEQIEISTNGEAYGAAATISVNGNADDATVAAWWTKNTAEFPRSLSAAAPGALA